MKNLQLTSLLILFALVGCVPALPDSLYPASDTYQVKTDIRFNLARRDFLLHVPPGIAPEEPLPLLVVLHGAFSTARQTEIETGFSALADQENFLVAYPEGIGIFGWLQHWNAGHCCGKAADDEIDDVGYIAEVIAAVSGRMAVDQRRIYLVGMSNGGMMAYRYAAERGHELAAVAVVSGAIGSKTGIRHTFWTMPAPQRPLSVIGFHGTGDEHIPVEGGISPLKEDSRSYRSVAEAMDFWSKANGCEREPLFDEELGGAVRSFWWDQCDDRVAVEYHLLKGWRHRWPAPHFTTDLPEGDRLQGFDATMRIWRFFLKHRR